MILVFLAPLVLLSAHFVRCFDAHNASTYEEHLLLKPLPRGDLLSSFTFLSKANFASFESQNFNYFPRALGQILQHAFTKELHVRFSSGRWDAGNWGQRPWGGSREGGTGAELWAWIEAANEQEAEARWSLLTNALSGLFCASLNFVDSTRTIRPVLAFSPEGHHAENTTTNLHLLHGTLPNEVVCTENLTPFLKLLPCKGKAGVSSLLDGHKMFDASWQSMAIDVRPSMEPELKTNWIEVEQTIDMVVNIERSKRTKEDPIPWPLPLENISCDPKKPYSHFGDACYPQNGPFMPAFSISEVFGRPIKGSCPLARNSFEASKALCVDVPSERNLSPVTQALYIENQSGDTTRCFDVSAELDFDLEFEAIGPILPEVLDMAVPVMERTLTGRGQQHGGLQTIITNPSETEPIRLVFLESLPWFMKPHFHTLRAEIYPTIPFSSNQGDDVVTQMFYRPAVDRKRASHLELSLKIPAASTLTLSYDFEKSILRYTEYPPDANRGFDIAPAIVRLLPSSTSSGGWNDSQKASSPIYVRTTSLLLYLPTPDFSMPYNTIILTSTVIALAFGSVYNILVRRFVAAEETPRTRSLKERLAGKLESLRAKFSRKTKGE